MSRWKASGALLLALFLPTVAFAAQSAVHGRHHHHRHHHARWVGPGLVGPGWDIYGPSAGYGGGYYHDHGPFGGELYSRNSGGVNSMANDFGTSGVLGHANGMPATGP